MTFDLLNELVRFFILATEAIFVLTSILIVVVVLLLVSQRKESKQMSARLQGLIEAAQALVDDVPIIADLIVQLREAKNKLQIVADDLRGQLENAQIDQTAIDAVRDQLVKADLSLDLLSGAAPGPNAQLPLPEPGAAPASEAAHDFLVPDNAAKGGVLA